MQASSITQSSGPPSSLPAQSPVVRSCLDIIEEHQCGTISHAQAIIKLVALLPEEMLEGALIDHLEQLTNVKCTRAITGQQGRSFNAPNDQPHNANNQDSQITPGDPSASGNKVVDGQPWKQTADKQPDDDDIPRHQRSTDEPLYPW